MTVAAWIARPLRRFLGTAVMLAGGMSVIPALHVPRPRFPPPDADRVAVWADGAWREIRDPARVRRIVASIRAHRGRPWRPMPEFLHHFHDVRKVVFHRGARVVGSADLEPNVLSVPAGDRWYGSFVLTAGDVADLARLLDTSPPVHR